jgi:peptidyl-prolyl cis-trans isomerase C
MSQTITKTKSVTAVTALALLALFSTGCKEKAPEVETVDLTQAEDLFEAPVQPNPLVPTADDVAITVDGEEITHGDIMQSVQMRMQQLSQQVPPQQLSQLYPQIRQEMQEMMIANILLTKAAEKSSLAVSDADLDAEIETIKAANQSEQTLEEALAANGVEFDVWKENLRKQILVGKLVEETTADVEPATATDAETYYKKNIKEFKTPESATASHILISFTPDDTDETKAQKKDQIKEIRKEILNGGNFEELAKEHSGCPSGQQGGSLGSFSRGQMVPAFEEVAFSQEIGTVSDIVETQFGYHIIKVTERSEGGVQALLDVQQPLIDFLSAQKKQEALVAYIDGLKENADIVIHEVDLDSASSE